MDLNDDPVDRLSDLPESIICHILSLFPTKYAARTSILSKRWKDLFLDVPNLVFDEELPSNHDAFIDFVHRRLLLCKTPNSITEFRFILPKLPRFSLINLWVVSLVFRSLNVKVLEITEYSGGYGTATPQCPPSEIFGWKTLAVLKLGGRKMVLQFPNFVTFPNLKVLDLTLLEMQSESKTFRFDHEGYPLLEVLRFVDVKFECSKDNNDFLGLEIFLCTLETLKLDTFRQKLVRIDIDTPSLRQLKYMNWEPDNVSPVQFSFAKSECLISAYIYSELYRRDLHIELLSKITSTVKDLTLYNFEAEDLTYSLPHFVNLTHLELFSTGLESMLSLLQNAPRLEVLYYEMLKGDLSYFVPPTNVPLCLAQNLARITVGGFAKGDICTETDVGLVRYFLQHGAVLERVILERYVTRITPEWRISTFEQLLNLPRRSIKCEIQLPK